MESFHSVRTPASTTSTEPFSPPPNADIPIDSNDDSDFARLYPVNSSAKDQFDQVAKRFAQDPTWMNHARQHIVFTLDGDTYNGYYRLNMKYPPEDSQRGWVAGSGFPQHPGQVSIILTPTHGTTWNQPAPFPPWTSQGQ